MTDQIRVVELFAGVGGFRVGLERASSRFKQFGPINGNLAERINLLSTAIKNGSVTQSRLMSMKTSASLKIRFLKR